MFLTRGLSCRVSVSMTCVTRLLLGRHINPKVVSEMLGHSHVSVTLSIYSHVMPRMQQHAADAMDQALGLRGNMRDNVQRAKQLGTD